MLLSDEEVQLDTWVWIVIAAGAVVLLLLVIAAVVRSRSGKRRSELKERFGSEYDHAVAHEGTRGAERHLSAVEQEHDDLNLRPLPEAARERYLEEWRMVETRFVSDPEDAVRAAERLVERVFEDRGYPSDADLERRVALVAVDHPDIAERYRHGRSMLDGKDDGDTTEKLRAALVDFRAVFEDMLESRKAA